jgi:hypothetical protein
LLKPARPPPPPGDTKVFLDGQEIPQLYHFGGLTSVVSTEMLRSIDFLPGGFGVRYGGATSGVVDVETKPGKDDGWGGVADVNVYHSEATAQGPVGANGSHGTLIAAARRSYIDAILPVILPGDLLALTVAPRYYDYQVRYDAPALANGARTAVFAYGSDDEFSFVLKKPAGDSGELRGAFDYHTLFHRVQAPMVLPLSRGWMLTMTPSAGYQDVMVDAGGLLKLDITRTDGSVRTEARGKLSENVGALFGMQASLGANRYAVTYRDDASGNGPGGNAGSADRTRNASGNYPSGTLSAYAQTELALGSVAVVPGLRADGHYPTDKISLDPRLAVRWTPSDRWSWKYYSGLYHQAPEPREWDAKVGNPSLNPPWAFQTGIGGRRRFGDKGSIESEVFYKYLGSLVVQRPADPSVLSSTSRYTNEGVGRAYGLEILAKRELSDRMYGWVAYTLSKSERADPYTRGGWHPFEYDQTHILTVLGGYKLSDKWELGGRFRYVTGNPTTEVTTALYDSDSDAWTPVQGATNAGRVPSFHQLDLRIDRKWQFSGWNLSAYLDMQNVYARQNPESVRYNYDYTRRYYVSGLSTLPLFGLRGEF